MVGAMTAAITRALWWTIAVGLLVITLAAWAASAQPGRDRVLGNVEIDEDSSCAVVRVGFNFPVRYVTHVPHGTGKELRIQLRPIAFNPADQSALSRREAASPPGNTFAALTEVVYEGDINGGPYLTLLFRRKVAFSVGQGDDYRSLIIAVVGPEPSGPCRPNP